MNIEMSIEARGIIDLHLSSELRKKKIDFEVCTISFFLFTIIYSLSLSLSLCIHSITTKKKTDSRSKNQTKFG